MSLFYTEEFVIQTPEVCAVASEAQAASQDAQPAEPVSNDEITWTIDRRPDFNLLNTYYLHDTTREYEDINIIQNVVDYYSNFRYFNQPLPEATPYNFSKKNIQINKQRKI